MKLCRKCHSAKFLWTSSATFENNQTKKKLSATENKQNEDEQKIT